MSLPWKVTAEQNSCLKEARNPQCQHKRLCPGHPPSETMPLSQSMIKLSKNPFIINIQQLYSRITLKIPPQTITPFCLLINTKPHSRQQSRLMASLFEQLVAFCSLLVIAICLIYVTRFTWRVVGAAMRFAWKGICLFVRLCLTLVCLFWLLLFLGVFVVVVLGVAA